MDWPVFTPTLTSKRLSGAPPARAGAGSWLALLELTSLLVAPGIGCHRAPDALPPPPVVDYSRSNSVEIVLGEPSRENGLRQAIYQADGLTVPAKVDGLDCHYVRPVMSGERFVYFAVDASFKRQPASNVVVEVVYFDSAPGTFDLEYDGAGVGTGQPNAYTHCPDVAQAQGLRTWETAVFHLKDARFANSQNAGADFRLRLPTTEFFVRRVTVTRD